MNEIKRGDMYWIAPPTESTWDRGTVKTRPGIIVSNDFNNRHAEHVEVVFLTTAPKSELPTHCTIRSGREISTALCEQISTVNKNQLEGYIGRATEAEMDMVELCILTSLDIGMKPSKPEQSSEADMLELQKNLIEAQKDQEIYKTLYDELLVKLLNK